MLGVVHGSVDLPTDLARWDGWCLELVNELLGRHPTGKVLYVELPRGPWRYHAALVLDGIVYDAWHPDVQKAPADYVAHVFGDMDPEWEVFG